MGLGGWGDIPGIAPFAERIYTVAMSHHMLVVEDDPDIQGYCNTALESAALGLAFCRVAAQALPGRLWVEDRDGGGSRFVLDVPGNATSVVV